MKKWLCAFLLVLLLGCSFNSKLAKDRRINYINNYESLKETFEIVAGKINIKNNDTICDIATGSGHSISLLSIFLPKTTQYFVEDIKKKQCNPKAFNSTFNYFNTTYNFNNYKFAIGTPTSIPYKHNSFKNITVFISLHEFSNTTVMLNEIKRIMKNEGRLHILESVYQKTPVVDSVCKFTYLSENELYNVVKKANLHIEYDTSFYKKTDTTNVYSKYLICKKS